MAKSKKMNKHEKQLLSNYVRQIADMLWLRDWDFDIYFTAPTLERAATGPEQQEWGATIEQTRHRQHAAICLAPDFKTNPAYQGQKATTTIVHELIHMHWVRCWDQIRVDLHEIDGVSQSVYDNFIANYERNMEYGVDALAYAFAELLPTIDWDQ